MGYDASALTFLGVRVVENDILKTTKIRGCDHKITKKNEKDQFCRTCGKPIWIEEDRGDIPERIGNLELKQTGTNDRAYFIGETINETGWNNKVVKAQPFTSEHINELKDEIKEILDQKGIARASDIMKTFGLYTILDESY